MPKAVMILELLYRMKFLVIVVLLFATNANGKNLQARKSSASNVVEARTPQPTADLSGNDGNENLGGIDLGLLGSDNIQELVKEIEEENSKLQSLKNEVDEMERAGDGMFTMFKRTWDMIEEQKVESDLAKKGKELTNAIKETYDEDAIKKMHLDLFEK